MPGLCQNQLSYCLNSCDINNTELKSEPYTRWTNSKLLSWFSKQVHDIALQLDIGVAWALAIINITDLEEVSFEFFELRNE